VKTFYLSLSLARHTVSRKIAYHTEMTAKHRKKASRSPEIEPNHKKIKLEQPPKKRLMKHIKADDDDDFGEGETEDT
jgi:hypothetical protein